MVLSGYHCIIDTKSIISPASPERTNFVERIQETIAPMPIAAAHKIEEGDAPRASRLQADLASRIVRMLKEPGRSETRREGKECVSTGRSRGWPYHSKKKRYKLTHKQRINH